MSGATTAATIARPIRSGMCGVSQMRTLRTRIPAATGTIAAAPIRKMESSSNLFIRCLRDSPGPRSNLTPPGRPPPPRFAPPQRNAEHCRHKEKEVEAEPNDGPKLLVHGDGELTLAVNFPLRQENPHSCVK